MTVRHPPRIPMLRAGVALCIGLAAGCRFDEQRQFDIRFPATLIVVNDTPEPVTIRAIRSNADAESTFVLRGRTVPPGESTRFRIAESDYRVLLAGDFVLIAARGDDDATELRGDTLPREGVSDTQRWDVTVTIPPAAE